MYSLAPYASISVPLLSLDRFSRLAGYNVPAGKAQPYPNLPEEQV